MRAGPLDDEHGLVGADDQDVAVDEPADRRHAPLGAAAGRTEVHLVDELHVLVEGHREKLRVALGQVFVRGAAREEQPVVERGLEAERVVRCVRPAYRP